MNDNSTPIAKIVGTGQRLEPINTPLTHNTTTPHSNTHAKPQSRTQTQKTNHNHAHVEHPEIARRIVDRVKGL
jgi:hypothetical protein